MNFIEKAIDAIQTALNIASKEDSLDAIRNQVSRQFRAEFSAPNDPHSEHVWVAEVFTDHAIASVGEKHFNVPYTRDDKGNVEFADRTEWKEVRRKQEWVETGKAIALDASLKVTKDASGNYRWTMVTSSAFEDREDEIVSIKALTADVERTDKGDDPGPARWWHVGKPDITTRSPGPGLDVANVDFRAIHGKSLIESGLFIDKATGEAFSKADNLAASIAFFHPVDQPDKDGVYHNIHSFERSLLPQGKQANLLATQPLIEKDVEMDKEKIGILEGIIGEESVKTLLGNVEDKEKRAEAAGISSKESEPAIDMAEFTKALAGVLPDVVKPIVQTEVKSAMETLKAELTSGSTSEEDATAKAVKEQAEREKAITGKLDTLTTGLAEVTKAVKELIGDQPRGNTGYRPTQDQSTLIDDEKVKQATQTDPLGAFVDFVAKAGSNGQ